MNINKWQFGSLLIAAIMLAGCGNASKPSKATSGDKDSGHTFKSAPTEPEVKSACYDNVLTIVEIAAGKEIPNPSGQTISMEQAKAIMEVTGVENGTPRISGAREVMAGIPDGTDLFPTRVTIKFTSMGEFTKKLDFYFFKNDHNEWKLVPEN